MKSFLSKAMKLPTGKLSFTIRFTGGAVSCSMKTARGFEGTLTCAMDLVEVAGSSLQELLENSIEKMRFYEKNVAGSISSTTARSYRSRKIG